MDNKANSTSLGKLEVIIDLDAAAHNCKFFRKDHHVTQEKLAIDLGLSSKHRVADFEALKKPLGVEELVNMAKHFEQPFHQFVTKKASVQSVIDYA